VGAWPVGGGLRAASPLRHKGTPLFGAALLCKQIAEASVRARAVLTGLPLMLLLGVLIGPASAHHKQGHHIPPGHLKRHFNDAEIVVRAPIDREEVCLVTTTDPDDPYAEIVATEWLLRGEAEDVLEEEGGFIIIHPALQTRADCEEFLWD
jgi:hypothetical protein